MSALLSDWFDRLGTSDTNRIMDTINTGIGSGFTTDTIVQNVLGTGALNGADGVTEIARRDAAALSQTAIAQTATDARAAWSADNTDIIGKEVWVATLDGVTCEECGALDGEVFDVGEGSAQCPAHINCRCVVVPSLDGSLIGDRPWTTATEDDLAAMSEEDRAAALEDMAGQVPASTTYQDWLMDQSSDFQDEVLGPERAALFRNGDMTLDQFISPNGDLYTLDELRAQGLAGDLAGDQILTDTDILTDLTPGIKATTEADVTRLEEAWAAQSDVNTVADLLKNSVENDAMLQAAGQAAADSLDGVTWNEGPIKTQESIEGKLIRRGLTPAQITDVVRGTAYLDNPAQAEAFIAKIAEQYPVLDANWRYISDSGYFDRTIKVLMPDGTVGEIQMGPEGMFIAKADVSVGGSGGHTLYNLWKDAWVKFGKGSDEAVALLQDMQAIYGAAQSQLPQDWQMLIQRIMKDSGISATVAHDAVQGMIDAVDNAAIAAAIAANKPSAH